MICQKCSKDIPEDSDFCPFCGESISVEPTTNCCTSCDKKLPEDSEFCPFCGKKKSSSIATTVESAAKKKASKAKIALITMAVIITGLATLNIVQYLGSVSSYKNNKSQNEVIDTLRNSVKNAENAKEKLMQEKSELNVELAELRFDLSFYQNHVVFVDDDGSNRYHKDPECYGFDSSYFWAYNTEAAEDQGYVPCPYCS